MTTIGQKRMRDRLGGSTWRPRALCATHPLPSLWDHIAHDGELITEQRVRHANAVAVCDRCPVRRQCLTDAIPGVDDGIRGGQLMPALRWEGDHRAQRATERRDARRTA